MFVFGVRSIVSKTEVVPLSVGKIVIIGWSMMDGGRRGEVVLTSLSVPEPR